MRKMDDFRVGIITETRDMVDKSYIKRTGAPFRREAFVASAVSLS